MKVSIVSSIYGDFDFVKAPIEQTVETDWIMVTDKPHDVPGWRTFVEPRPQLHPRLAAKVPKCTPEMYSDADVLIWIDGNLEVLSPNFTQWCLDSLGDSLLCQHRNPYRLTVFNEVGAAGCMFKYLGLPIREQAGYYVSTGFPSDYGTWWTGLMIKSKNCPSFGDAWLAENVRWTYEDQISQPFVLHGIDLRPTDLPIEGIDDGARSFELFRLHDHTRNN